MLARYLHIEFLLDRVLFILWYIVRKILDLRKLFPILRDADCNIHRQKDPFDRVL